ncbi:hypothetical protein ACFQ07_06685, partial [Actinomadura adrarensis]
ARLTDGSTDPAVFTRLLTGSEHREVRAAAAVALRNHGTRTDMIEKAMADELAAAHSALDRPLSVIGLTRPAFLRPA